MDLQIAGANSANADMKYTLEWYRKKEGFQKEGK